MSVDEYSYSFLLLPKINTATSTEHSTDNSWAFLNRPPFRFKKVLLGACVSRYSICSHRTASYHIASHRANTASSGSSSSSSQIIGEMEPRKVGRGAGLSWVRLLTQSDSCHL